MALQAGLKQDQGVLSRSYMTVEGRLKRSSTSRHDVEVWTEDQRPVIQADRSLMREFRFCETLILSETLNGMTRV